MRNLKTQRHGEVREITVKGRDSLPVGTILEYEGDTVPEGYEPYPDNDTGWIDIPILSGASGALKCRKIGKIVNIIGNVSNLNGQYITLAELPYKPVTETTLLFPLGVNGIAIAILTGGGTLLMLYAGLNGDNFVNSSTVSINHTFLTD